MTGRQVLDALQSMAICAQYRDQDTTSSRANSSSCMILLSPAAWRPLAVFSGVRKPGLISRLVSPGRQGLKQLPVWKIIGQIRLQRLNVVHCMRRGNCRQFAAQIAVRGAYLADEVKWQSFNNRQMFDTKYEWLSVLIELVKRQAS